MMNLMWHIHTQRKRKSEAKRKRERERVTYRAMSASAHVVHSFIHWPGWLVVWFIWLTCVWGMRVWMRMNSTIQLSFSSSSLSSENANHYTSLYNCRCLRFYPVFLRIFIFISHSLLSIRTCLCLCVRKIYCSGFSHNFCSFKLFILHIVNIYTLAMLVYTRQRHVNE